MEEKITPINNTPCLCWKCLTEHDNIHVIEFGNLGYGSRFDGWGSRIQLCDHCFEESNPAIWNLNEVSCDDYDNTEYEHEEEMFGFFGKLDIRSKELLENRFANGWNADGNMDPQDWIDYELGILPHEKCQEYGMYSPDEIAAYKSRFPACNHTVIVIYSDGSKGSRCPYGGHGSGDGSCDEYNIWNACYGCAHYQERTATIRNVARSDIEDYDVYAKFKANFREYIAKFEQEHDETEVL